MRYLLDTCIISKLRRLNKYPDPILESWISKHPESSYLLSTLTLGEIQGGLSKLNMKKTEEKKQRLILENWFQEELIPRFEGRILSVDNEVSIAWGRLCGEGRQKGVAIPVVDGIIAATAIAYNLTVVTENINDFIETGATLFNPWLR